MHIHSPDLSSSHGNDITFFDSQKFTDNEKIEILNISYVFFGKYIGNTSYIEFTDLFLEHEVSIRYTNGTIQLSQIMRGFYRKDPYSCIDYMNTIMQGKVFFRYNNGGIEIIQGGPGKPTNGVIGGTRNAANDALYRKVA